MKKKVELKWIFFLRVIYSIAKALRSVRRNEILSGLKWITRTLKFRHSKDIKTKYCFLVCYFFGILKC